jgi:hypothetical protein
MLAANITAVPENPAKSDIVTYCCQLKADLRDVIMSGNIHDCTLGQRLNDIACPDANDPDAAGKAKQAVAELLALAVDLYRECVCSAILPPCPNDCPDDCVPIATVTVRSSDLHVLEVCNWSSRKFAVTMPMLGYWLSWLPFGAALRRLVNTICCPPQRTGIRLNEKLNVTSEMASARSAKSEQAAAAFATPIRMTRRYAQSAAPAAGFEATLLHSLGVTGVKGVELATPEELANPFAAAALSRLFGPGGLNLSALEDALAEQDEKQPRAEAPPESPAEAAPAEHDHTARISELEKSLESLQRKVNRQDRTISELRKGQSQ